MQIVRTTLLLTALAIFAPTPPPSADIPASVTPALFSAATQSFADVQNFCRKQAGVCETAAYVAARLEVKARYGAILIFDWANEATSDPRQAAKSTLALNDYVPEWRKPKS
jgi:Family of unknown function (DUF5330)